MQITAWAEVNLKKIPELEMLYAIPNGGKRNIITASKLKKEGVKAGVWDMSLDFPKGGYHGLKIEVKTKDGRLSKNQAEWKKRYEKYNYKCIVVRSLEDFIKEIEAYLSESNNR